MPICTWIYIIWRNWRIHKIHFQFKWSSFFWRINNIREYFYNRRTNLFILLYIQPQLTSWIYKQSNSNGLFDWTPINEKSVHWKFSENKISSETENYKIKSPNAEKLQVNEPSGGGGDEGDDDDNPNCPDDPGEYLNSELYTYTCGNTFDFQSLLMRNTQFSPSFTRLLLTLALSTDGPIIKAGTNKDLTGIKDQMKLVNCQFSKCYCYTTHTVYIESAETSRAFEI